MGRVAIEAEQEGPRGWTYRVLVHPRAGKGASAQEHTVRLSYRDHDFWCGGRLAPSELIRELLEYVLANRSEAMPDSFDAARIRRWLPGVDKDFRSVAPQ